MLKAKALIWLGKHCIDAPLWRLHTLTNVNTLSELWECIKLEWGIRRLISKGCVEHQKSKSGDFYRLTPTGWVAYKELVAKIDRDGRLF